MKNFVLIVMYFSIRVWYKFKALLTGNRAFLFLQNCFSYSYLKFFGVETEFGYVKLVGLPIIKKAAGSKIVLGRGVTLVSASRGNVAGINHPVILATLAPGAIIQLDECGLSGSSVCASTHIKIGRHSGLGANSCVYDTDFHAVDHSARKSQQAIHQAKAEPVEIGEDVWIAANTLVLKGVRIGDRAVIGAGSVVISNIPKNSLAAGNPAKVIKVIAP